MAVNPLGNLGDPLPPLCLPLGIDVSVDNIPCRAVRQSTVFCPVIHASGEWSDSWHLILLNDHVVGIIVVVDVGWLTIAGTEKPFQVG